MMETMVKLLGRNTYPGTLSSTASGSAEVPKKSHERGNRTTTSDDELTEVRERAADELEHDGTEACVGAHEQHNARQLCR
jgi:hypothetical protein